MKPEQPKPPLTYEEKREAYEKSIPKRSKGDTSRQLTYDEVEELRRLQREALVSMQKHFPNAKIR